ncbi:hypothetical protein J4401_04715 [Candidatus Woesearchaeota archaeon]|nr:hypothetical protein [Candidatus Woesearchaeota archaeon]
MELFGKGKREMRQRIQSMEDSIKASFARVRQDMETANSWLNSHYQRSISLEVKFKESQQSLAGLQSDMKRVGQELAFNARNLSECTEAIRKIQSLPSSFITQDKMDYHIESMSSELMRIEKKIDELSYLKPRLEAMKHQLAEHLAKPDSQTEIEKKIDMIQERLRGLSIKKTPKEKLVQKVAKGRHDYIKAVLLGYVKKYGKISAGQLRDIAVEEQNLTSKSTLYRILEEIESEEEIGVIVQGKEKVYISKPRKLIR